MKRFTVITYLIISIWFQCPAQDSLFILHPIVGEIIDRNEKSDYLLFPEINDSIFKFCNIKHVKDEFFVNSYLVSDSIVTLKLNISDINQYKLNIDKLHQYYLNETTEDSLKDLKVLILKEGNSFKIINIGIDSEVLSNEVRSNDRLRDDAERLKLHEQGLEPSSVIIDFSYIKINKNRKK